MQTGFVGFGILLAGGLLFKARSLGRANLPDLLVSLYGLAILRPAFTVQRQSTAAWLLGKRSPDSLILCQPGCWFHNSPSRRAAPL